MLLVRLQAFSRRGGEAVAGVAGPRFAAVRADGVVRPALAAALEGRAPGLLLRGLDRFGVF